MTRKGNTFSSRWIITLVCALLLACSGTFKTSGTKGEDKRAGENDGGGTDAVDGVATGGSDGGETTGGATAGGGEAAAIITLYLAQADFPPCSSINQGQLILEQGSQAFQRCEGEAWVAIQPEIALGASVASADLGDGSITRAALASDGCSNGQILARGSGWVCANDASGITEANAGNIADDAVAARHIDRASCVDGEVLQHNGTSWACAPERSPYPYRVQLFPEDSQILAGNAYLTSLIASQHFTTYSRQEPPADGDSFEFDFKLAEGNYVVEVLGIAFNNRGLVDWYFNDMVTAVETGQDWYSGSNDFNTVKTFNITVTAPGDQKLRAVINGQNASSSGYYLPWTRILIRQQ